MGEIDNLWEDLSGMGLRRLKLFPPVDHRGAPEEPLKIRPSCRGGGGFHKALQLDYIQ